MELKNLYEHTYMQTISNCQTFVDNNLIIKDNNTKKVWWKEVTVEKSVQHDR